MKFIDFPESNLTLHKPEDWKDNECGALKVHASFVETPEGRQVTQYISCWEPSEAEQKELRRTGKIYLLMLGMHPPVSLHVFNPLVAEIPTETVMIFGNRFKVIRYSHNEMLGDQPLPYPGHAGGTFDVEVAKSQAPSFSRWLEGGTPCEIKLYTQYNDGSIKRSLLKGCKCIAAPVGKAGFVQISFDHLELPTE